MSLAKNRFKQYMSMIMAYFLKNISAKLVSKVAIVATKKYHLNLPERFVIVLILVAGIVVLPSMYTSGQRLNDLSYALYLSKKDNKRLNKEVSNLLAEIESNNQVIEHAMALEDLLAKNPSILPADGPISSRFGLRNNPHNIKVKKHHNGVDIAAPYASIVYASADGEVIFNGRKGSFGNLIIIKHEGGMQTQYGHLKTILVKKGDKVKQGDKIGLVGNTGNSKGSHLHYGVKDKNGKYLDPLDLIVKGYPIKPKNNTI